jgi:carbon-monoxide dehydrogenase medium subunit
MKPAAFAYHVPHELPLALDLLARLAHVQVLAGGQSLVPLLNARLATPAHVVDINRLSELDYLRQSGEVFTIGALTRQRALEFSPLIARYLPLVGAAVRRVGHRQTRNRGTIGGSLAHLDPAAELALMAVMHDGTLRLSSQGGEREIAMADYALGAWTTARQPHELLTSITMRPWPEGHGFGFHEFSRRHADWAIASAAVLMVLDAQGCIEHVAMGLGGVEVIPGRRRRGEQMLAGKQPTPELLAAAAGQVDDLQPLDDMRAPAWYRRELSKVLMQRALADALQGAQAHAASRREA